MGVPQHPSWGWVIMVMFWINAAEKKNAKIAKITKIAKIASSHNYSNDKFMILLYI